MSVSQGKSSRFNLPRSCREEFWVFARTSCLFWDAQTFFNSQRAETVASFLFFFFLQIGGWREHATGKTAIFWRYKHAEHDWAVSFVSPSSTVQTGPNCPQICFSNTRPWCLQRCCSSLHPPFDLALLFSTSVTLPTTGGVRRIVPVLPVCLLPWQQWLTVAPEGKPVMAAKETQTEKKRERERGRRWGGLEGRLYLLRLTRRTWKSQETLAQPRTHAICNKKPISNNVALKNRPDWIWCCGYFFLL